MSIYLGKTARQLRETLGMTQRAMAEALGITPVHLCNIENGKSQPSPELLNRYREKWEVDLYVLAWCLQGNTDKLPVGLRDAANVIAEGWQAGLRDKMKRLHALSE